MLLRMLRPGARMGMARGMERKTKREVTRVATVEQARVESLSKIALLRVNISYGLF